MMRDVQKRSVVRFVPWLLFLSSLVGVFGIYIIPVLLGHSFWDPVRSGAARSLLWLSVMGLFACCCAAPFFSGSLRPSMKFAAAFAAAIIFIIVVLLALGASALVSPAGTESLRPPNQRSSGKAGIAPPQVQHRRSGLPDRERWGRRLL
jgi:hypothetical protein